MESQSCKCLEKHCIECTTSKCSSCSEGYTARHGVTCSLADKTIDAVSTAGASTLGVLIAMGITTSLFTGAAEVVWSAFEVLQIIELVAMVDFSCPENFDQFLNSFEFLQLRMPNEVNLFANKFLDGEEKIPFTDRFNEFG